MENLPIYSERKGFLQLFVMDQYHQLTKEYNVWMEKITVLCARWYQACPYIWIKQKNCLDAVKMIAEAVLFNYVFIETYFLFVISSLWFGYFFTRRQAPVMVETTSV